MTTIVKAEPTIYQEGKKWYCMLYGVLRISGDSREEVLKKIEQYRLLEE